MLLTSHDAVCSSIGMKDEYVQRVVNFESGAALLGFCTRGLSQRLQVMRLAEHRIYHRSTLLGKHTILLPDGLQQQRKQQLESLRQYQWEDMNRVSQARHMGHSSALGDLSSRLSGTHLSLSHSPRYRKQRPDLHVVRKTERF